MEKELLKEGEFEIKIEDGQLKMIYAGKGGGVTLHLEGDYFLDKLAEAIPGELDDKVIDMIKLAMKM